MFQEHVVLGEIIFTLCKRSFGPLQGHGTSGQLGVHAVTVNAVFKPLTFFLRFTDTA